MIGRACPITSDVHLSNDPSSSSHRNTTISFGFIVLNISVLIYSLLKNVATFRFGMLPFYSHMEKKVDPIDVFAMVKISGTTL